MAAGQSPNYAWVWVLIVVIGGAAVWMYVSRDDGTDVPAEDLAKAPATDTRDPLAALSTTPKPATIRQNAAPEPVSLESLVDQTLNSVDPIPDRRPAPILPEPLAVREPLPLPRGLEPEAVGTTTLQANPTEPVVVAVDPVRVIASDPAPVIPAPRPVRVVEPAPTRSAPVSAAPLEYVIREGDTYSTIAEAIYRDETMWLAIQKANPKVDARHLQIGQKIKLPDPEQDRRDREAELASVSRSVASPAGGAQTVTVRSGDALSLISKRVYGSSAYWPAIFDANRGKLAHPDDIQVGMVLTIPPKPAKVPEVPTVFREPDGSASEQTIK